MRETREQRRAEAEERKALAKTKREHEKRVRDLEMQILKLEGRQKELTEELEKPETYEARRLGDGIQSRAFSRDDRDGATHERVGEFGSESFR